MDFSFLSKYYMFFLTGTKNTVLLSVCSVFIGVILGLFVSLMKLSKNKVLNIISSVYIEFLRGTPILVQIFIVYYGLPRLGLDMPPFVSGVIALSINSSAYVAEIVRTGIQAVDKGQMEAARSLGMSHNMAMRYIIIPQGLKNILPALGNEFIVLIKESSIVMVVGIADVMYNTNIVRGNTYQPFEPLMIAALIYFVLTFTLSKFMNKIERGMAVSD
ncbi:amino acid ABC transporter permease [Tepidibacter aestuarii]|uniref:amino acid ABC transporter permease n=1 Tax=Tepidibacter aestuarii TaxID=2925782 RepID=UPI0020C16CE2|nr:amino acid ABC transporter permease [Tepidibacter aestuarii]CAH2214073.1 high affinity arginine ABC transporter (permease) [Tepidibacter aestuarii]